MSSAKVAIAQTTMTTKYATQAANAAFHGDERMLNVLLRNLGTQGRQLMSHVNLGGIVTGRVADGQGSQTIVLGFKPAYVKAVQLSGIVAATEVFSGMALSSALLTQGGPAGGTTGSFLQVITTGGFSINATGFKGGTAVFPSGKPCCYVAYRRIGP